MVRLINNFTLLCKKTENGEEICSCDFRVNIYGCEHSELYVTSGWILAIMSILATIMASGLLIYLIKVRKQPFFLPASNERGWIRPKPMHSYHLLVIAYMALEAFHLIALEVELYPSVKAAELGNVSAVVFSASAAILYTISIVYATPNVQFNENYELLCKKYGPNILLVDIIGILLFLLPIFAWFPLSSLTGEYADRNDIEAANYYFAAKYIAIVIWEVIYSLVLIYFWYKLMSVIKSYIKVIEDRNISSGVTSSGQVQSIKKSARNITTPVMAIFGGLLSQAIIFVIMSISHRTNTIYVFMWNMFYYWIQYVFFPLLALTVESFLIYYTVVNYKDSLTSSANNSNNNNSNNNNSKAE
ncbi:hypothetical protein RhiirA5_496789 [Rhizophagus irregularis]|uniref:Uncharacterized protein n=3 Tax=Rhizophagus irregularis TaxID=588596 RepID=A0A2I1DUC8_9GLOM|nr:hypothetical protein RhiirA5_496789 [Rhizophagus irregularis]GBC31581.2 hypothetical protein GLOIN_2v1573083 [Rhizophagus irregularis DAOM 181602=DAOM 197198]PKY13454.1 hypothetical protein RhiirB3_518813 [Rhizophagus irregularis]UZO20726.1 hypothetical protein OCT59_013144 [Rhizophagus irregularis]CAB4477501.1 unnamed protein product [Rhizophagus irregularis]